MNATPTLRIITCSILLSTASFFSHCGSEDPDNTPAPPSGCSTSTATFTEANVIIQASCATGSSCHGSGSTSGPGPLLTYNQIFAARTTIRSAVATGLMPQGTTLTTSKRNTIICWIENGAENN